MTYRTELWINSVFELLHVCVYMLVAQSCPTLWLHGLWPTRLLCPWDSPGKNSGVGCHALLQGIFQPRDRTQVSCIAGRFFTIWATREDLKYVYYNLNCGLRMLLQRSKCHIDYKIQKYFALWKYTVQNASHRLAGCYFIVSCVLPSSTWNLLLWFWNSYSASHTKSLWRRNK